MATPSPRSNILFLMDDRHRHDYLGFVNGDYVDTPNLDRLAAAGGMHLTQCCTNTPLCVPTRIALATDLLATRMGALTDNDTLHTVWHTACSLLCRSDQSEGRACR